jgi:hypothetical protein
MHMFFLSSQQVLTMEGAMQSEISSQVHKPYKRGSKVQTYQHFCPSYPVQNNKVEKQNKEVKCPTKK